MLVPVKVTLPWVPASSTAVTVSGPISGSESLRRGSNVTGGPSSDTEVTSSSATGGPEMEKLTVAETAPLLGTSSSVSA